MSLQDLVDFVKWYVDVAHRFTVALAVWPVAAMVCVAILRSDVSRVLTRLRTGKWGGAELQFDAHQVETVVLQSVPALSATSTEAPAAPTATPVPTPTPTPTSAPADYMEAVADRDRWKTIAIRLHYMNIEKSLVPRAKAFLKHLLAQGRVVYAEYWRSLREVGKSDAEAHALNAAFVSLGLVDMTGAAVSAADGVRDYLDWRDENNLPPTPPIEYYISDSGKSGKPV